MIVTSSAAIFLGLWSVVERPSSSQGRRCTMGLLKASYSLLELKVRVNLEVLKPKFTCVSWVCQESDAAEIRVHRKSCSAKIHFSSMVGGFKVSVCVIQIRRSSMTATAGMCTSMSGVSLWLASLCVCAPRSLLHTRTKEFVCAHDRWSPTQDGHGLLSLVRSAQIEECICSLLVDQIQQF